MGDSPTEVFPRISSAAPSLPYEDLLETGARGAGPVLDPAPRSLAAGMRRYGPHAALTAWLFAAAWLTGSHYLGRASTVVQQENARGVELGEAAQKTTEELPVQKADVEAISPAQSPSGRSVASLGNPKPRLDPAKTEITAAKAELAGKAERSRRNPAEKRSKGSDRVDRIGLEIKALLAAEPSKAPIVPGAPRPLATVAPAAITNSLAENSYGRRAN